MRVLVLGAGAREHALAWKISQSPALSSMIAAPGNPGIAQLCETVPVRPEDQAAVVNLAREQKVDFVVVGPEGPLVDGIVDALARAGIAAFGPSAAAARIEGSKAFAKELMKRAGVPTARSEVFEDAAAAERRARELGDVVVKADGLAAGKGVIVARGAEEAAAAVRSVSRIGPAAARLVLEELLEGEEVSVIALCDGERYALLPVAQDHKRVGDGDTGPNTGGMGAYCPAPFLDARGLDRAGEEVIAPVLAELRRRMTPFRGALYAGLILGPKGPQVLEFNCRLGDPETQVLMMQLGGDLLPLLAGCARGQLGARALPQKEGASVGVVLAAEGYPAPPVLGDEIQGLGEVPEDAAVFHAGTRAEGGRILTSGGRVLTVCARGDDLAQARERAYAAAAAIRFRGMHYRRDIGAHALRR